MRKFCLVISIPHLKDLVLNMTLCAPNEKQDRGYLGQKGLSDDTKVDFDAKKNHG